MSRCRAFIKRNLTEMVREPVLYLFCAGFPVVMLILFFVINRFTEGNTPVFELPSLVPGIMMFSFSFVMLTVSLLVSKDHASAFLVRLYISPMKTHEFLIGYTVPALIVGFVQEVLCVVTGMGLALMSESAYFSFGAELLLMLEMLPMLLMFTFIGIFFGCVLGEKAAPGVCSVLISAAGILGGAWMPLDAMGGFETFCRFLPFYPSVYLGRVITGAWHSITDYLNPVAEAYVFDEVAQLGFIPIAVFLLLSFAGAMVAMKRKRKL